MPISWDDTAIQERLTRAAMRGVIKATELVREEAISLILNTPKTGRVYRRRGVEHIASAPGEPPASDTGRLVNSIKTEYDIGALNGYVTCSVDYGFYLEFGTQTIEPRPFLRPALDAMRQKAQELIQIEITREMAR